MIRNDNKITTIKTQINRNNIITLYKPHKVHDYKNIPPLIQSFEKEAKLFMETVQSKYPKESMNSYLVKASSNFLCKTLIEVHQNDVNSKYLDPVIFAQRQTEIMLSRTNLIATIEALKLDIQKSKSEILEIMRQNLTFRVTKGGLIELKMEITPFQSDITKAILQTIVSSYRKTKENRIEKTYVDQLSHIKKLRRIQEDTIDDYRARFFALSKKYKIENSTDIEKATLKVQSIYDRAKNDYLYEQGLLLELNSRERKIKKSLSKSLCFWSSNYNTTNEENKDKRRQGAGCIFQ